MFIKQNYSSVSLLLLFISIIKIPKVFCTRSTLHYKSGIQGSNQLKVHDVPESMGPLLRTLDEDLAHCGSSQIDIREISITQAQKYFKSGELSSLLLTSCYLDRILKMNPHLKAVIQINRDAVRSALKLDLERMLGIIRSPIHGIPILIKDNIATLDTTQNTAGAIAMEFLIPKRDAEVVKRLRDAGAVILGKTNPSEWAYFRGTNEPEGWSGRGGQTLSPYVLTSNPSGSSTGSAVAVAANLGVAALGTETDGSIISPSSRHSLIGLKPTLNAVSTKGVIPISFSQDVVGPMTRTVGDSAILLGIMSDIHLSGCDKYLQSCLSQKHITIGVVRYPFWNVSDPITEPMISDLENALNSLQKTGHASIIDPVSGNSTLLNSVLTDQASTVYRHEFKYGINKYLHEDVQHFEFLLNRKIHSLADIVEFNKKHPPLKNYNQVQLIASEATDGLENRTYIELRDKNKGNAQAYILSLLDKNKLDVLATPCDSNDTLVLFTIGAIAGFPSITVPSGVSEEGIPFGLCFLGRPNSEAELLKIAFILENEFPRRAMPSFIS